MLTGAPLPIAILNRSPITGGELRVESGHVDIARIEFASSGIGFTAVDAGKFLAIWSTETLRQELSIAVAAPTSAAISRNSNSWKIRSFDQLMSVVYAPLVSGIAPGPGNRWNVSSHTKQTRSFMPFEHVSHSWLCDLSDGESSSLTLTIADDSQLKWMLAVIRIPGPTVENRNTNTIKGSTGGPTPSTGVTCISIANYTNIGTWAIASTVSGGSVDFLFPAPRSGIAFTAKFRIFPTSSSVAGSITITLSQRLGPTTTTIGTGTMTLTLDGFQELSLPIASTVFSGAEFLGLLITNIDAGESFQMEFSFDAA